MAGNPPSAMESAVADYLTKEVVTSPDLLPLKKDAPLVTSGILDSLSLLKLISFIEKQFGVNIAMEEVVPENFETIDTIVSFVSSKKGA